MEVTGAWQLCAASQSESLGRRRGGRLFPFQDTFGLCCVQADRLWLGSSTSDRLNLEFQLTLVVRISTFRFSASY